MSEKIEITIDQTTMAKFFKRLSEELLAGRAKISEVRQSFDTLERSELYVKIYRPPLLEPVVGTITRWENPEQTHEQ